MKLPQKRKALWNLVMPVTSKAAATCTIYKFHVVYKDSPMQSVLH